MPDDKPTQPIDVAKPGTTPASPTSRPVIVSHSPPVSDPMVSAEKPANVLSGSGSSKVKIMPSASAAEVQKVAAKEDDEAHAVEDAEKKPDAPDAQARLAEIIDSGEYNVSVKQKSSSGSAGSFITTVIIIVLIGVVALYLLSDLNVIDLGIKLPVQFFK